MNRFLAIGCFWALTVASVAGLSLAQETDKGGKTAAKKAGPGRKPSATEQPTAAPQSKKSWTEAELGGAKAAYAEITRAPTGRPILAIHYPWRTYTRPSVEVRWMADDEADTAELRPLRFVADIMKGEVTSAVYRAREAAWDTPTTRTLKDHDRDFEIHGARNLLGRPAVTVVFPTMPGGEDRARAIFFPLDGWAVDRQTLWLELPAEQFSQPGRIRVWFYREGAVLWWKTLAWKGFGKN